VNQYSPLLRSIAWGFRLSSEHAADAEQTTWLKFVKHIGSIREPEKVAGWLASTMRRECLQALRSGRREQPVENCGAEYIGPAGSVESSILIAEERELLWAAVDRLPHRQAQVIRQLSAVPPPSYREVSKALSMAIGTIGPTRANALVRLREMLDEPFEPGVVRKAS
jgi:RNA polymerase sigma factor (sigma-70 family)